jgi:hypothetical protein
VERLGLRLSDTIINNNNNHNKIVWLCVCVVACRSDKFEIIAEGEGADDVPRDETNLIVTGSLPFLHFSLCLGLLLLGVASALSWSFPLGSCATFITASPQTEGCAYAS